jgi:D-threonate/D-erythronate kinase
MLPYSTLGSGDRFFSAQAGFSMIRPLRLLADDLTGALDSAAAFGAPDAPLPVAWRSDAVTEAGAFAFDSGTREKPADEAAALVARLAPLLFAGADSLAYKKVDSLLRGSEAEEIDAVLRARPFARVLVAPAFPAQRRTTRDGRQGVLAANGWEALPTDLAARLERLGHAVARRRPGDAVPDGVSVWDADTDADLDAIAAAAGEAPGILFVGSGGLAAALARRQARETAAAPRLARPLLGLFGTHHPVMLGQLASAAHACVAIRGANDAPRVAARLSAEGAAFVTLDLSPDIPREAAAARIAAAFAGLVARLDQPGTLVVAGGETLRALCDALGADALGVTGELMPGIPCSRLAGGRWNGTAVVSKSGAFGAPDLLSSILAAEPAPHPGAPTP